jgi:hypothetical protein
MNLAELPSYISVLFVALCLDVVMLWIVGISNAASKAGFTASEKKKLLGLFTLVMILWLAATGILASNGFYLKTDTMPPKILLVVGPALIAGIFLSRTKTAARLLAASTPSYIVAAQSFRLGVEIIFYFLLINNAIPSLMTFEGRNMDIFVGLSALPVVWLYKRGTLNDQALRLWNYIGLIILLNVMIHGMLSAPSPIQQITTVPVNNFMLHFPFVWLIALLVPTAFSGHLLSLRQLALRRAQPAVAIA